MPTRTPLRPWACLTLAIAVSAPGQAAGRQSACGGCLIEIDTVAVLTGVPDSLGGLTDTFQLRRDSNGRYYVVSQFVPWIILVFDSSGAFDHTLGAHGSGPGEFANINSFALDSVGNLHIFDRQNGRYTELTREGDVVRTRRAAAVILDALVLRGAIVVNAVTPSPQGIGIPLHVADVDHERLIHFPSGQEVYDATLQPALRRTLFSAQAPGAFWAAHATRYQLDLWNHDRTLIRTLRVSRPWFEGYGASAPVTPRTPPQPRLVGGAEDSDGQIWTVVQVPAEDWASHLKAVDIPGGRGRAYMVDGIGAFATIVEVLRAEDGSLLASTKVNGYLRGFVSPGIAWGYAESEDKNGRIEILAVHLIRPAAPNGTHIERG